MSQWYMTKINQTVAPDLEPRTLTGLGVDPLPDNPLQQNIQQAQQAAQTFSSLSPSTIVIGALVLLTAYWLMLKL